ncbi:MAG TPA: hypothetical protein PKM25_05205, partial [Candidatus Ozemobacteraceae bacterium]|nr:hypothetical protein [Candidatus Ozemobacteraceae bacterium]
MLTLLLVVESAAIVLLFKMLWDVRRRQRDLRTALRNRSPYLVEDSAGLFPNAWRDTVADANELIAAL